MDLEIGSVEGYMMIIRSLDDRIGEIEKKIKEEAGIIMSIPEFSYFSTMTIYAYVGDIGRFLRTKTAQVVRWSSFLDKAIRWKGESRANHERKR